MADELIQKLVPESNRWKLDKEIDFEHRSRSGVIPRHLGKIADSMTEWDGKVADELGLTVPERRTIRIINPALQAREALGKWKSKNGASATYKALIEVFLAADKKGYATNVCKLFESAGGESGDFKSGAAATSFPQQTSAAHTASHMVDPGVRTEAEGPGAQERADISQTVAAEVPNSTIAADGGLVSFSSKMKPDQLNQWLLQELGEVYKDDIDKLRRINGTLFLMLPDNDRLLESLKFDEIFKILILDKIREVKESMIATPARNDEANLPGPPPSELVPCTFECGTADLDVIADSASAKGGELSAWVPENVIWPKHKRVLQVKFLNDIPTHWTYDKGGLNRGNIKQWANIWSDRGDGIIPRFEFVEGNAPSDIRIIFVDADKENSRSKVGRKAEDQASNKPTMWLNLRSGGDDYKKHVVIHEFGHALGLGHEHQRSDFWKRLKSCIDIDAIKSEVGEESFKVNWGKDSDYRRKNATSYDPQSVMHYPFKKEWLKPDYSNTTKVEEALKEEYITSKVAAILRGVLERAQNPYITEPSTEDINLLKQLYSQGSSKGGTCTILAPPSLDRVESDSLDITNQGAAVLSHPTLIEQLWSHAAKWKEIGTYLGFRQPELNFIQSSPVHFMGAPGSWLSAMLEAWLEWKPGDKRGSSESASLESLKEAVSKAGLGKTAAELHY